MIKALMVCMGLEPGWQDGRPRRIIQLTSSVVECAFRNSNFKLKHVITTTNILPNLGQQTETDNSRTIDTSHCECVLLVSRLLKNISS